MKLLLYVGYEPAIAKAICDELEVTCKFIPTNDLDARLELLNNGSADLAVADITVTPEREGIVDFIEPFYYGSNFQIYSANETANITDGWEGLAGKPVCFTEGSASEEIVARLNMIPVIIPVADEAATQEQVLANIRNGECVGFFTDYAPSSKFGLSPIELPAQRPDPDTPSYLGMAVAKGNEELKEEITAANEALFEGGADSEILELERQLLLPYGLQVNEELAAVANPAPAAAPGLTPAPAPDSVLAPVPAPVLAPLLAPAAAPISDLAPVLAPAAAPISDLAPVAAPTPETTPAAVPAAEMPSSPSTDSAPTSDAIKPCIAVTFAITYIIGTFAVSI